jgi:glycosyltransferase involved in cell wall biosynthesis
MPKSILVVTGIFPPDSGGPAKFSQDFGIWASDNHFGVNVLTYSSEMGVAQPDQQLRIHRVSRKKSIPVRYLRMICGIGRNARKSSAVLAVGAFLETYLASRIFRFSYVVKVPGDIVWERARNTNATSLGIEEFQDQDLNFRYRLFRWLYSCSLRNAQTVIVPSLGLLDLCLKWGVPRGKIQLVYNSVDLKAPLGAVAQGSRIDCLTICRLTPWKGVDELIQYCANHNLELVVAGDGPERTSLQALAAALQAKVEFTGNISNESVRHLLARSRIFVLNSYYEGLPHALIEARAAGVLSIGRKGTGSEEVINDDSDGYLVRPDRNLEATLDLAYSSLPNANIFVERAKADALSRFDKEINYAVIAGIVLGNR